MCADLLWVLTTVTVKDSVEPRHTSQECRKCFEGGMRKPHESDSASQRFALALLTGGTASATAKTVVAPLERARLVLQTQHLMGSGHGEYKGLGDTLARILREQGFASFWRGNLVNLLRIVPTYGLRFSFFDYFRNLASVGVDSGQPLSLPRQMLSGAMSGSATVLVTYPLDLTRTHMSTDLHSKHGRSVLQAFQDVLSKDGVRGLYRGIGVSVVEIAPYVAISLGGYEYGKQHIPAQYDGAGAKLVLAWATGLAGSLFCFPMDTVKRRLMLGGSRGLSPSPQVPGAIGYALSMYRTGGIRIFYRGCAINAFKSAPAAALTFVLNDTLKDFFQRVRTSRQSWLS